MKKINSKWIFLGIGIVIGVVVLGFLVSRINSTNQTSLIDSQKVTIEDKEKGSTIVFHRDGLVEYKDKTSEYSTVWSSEKMNAFFEYIANGDFTLGTDYEISLSNGGSAGASDEDELLGTIIDEVTGGGSTNPTPAGGSIGELFNTPNPSGGNNGNGTNPTSNPGGGGGGPTWCKHWRLSYCADHLYPDPTPTPADDPGVIKAKDCSEWRTQSENKTVISGDSCAQYFQTPTPE